MGDEKEIPARTLVDRAWHIQKSAKRLHKFCEMKSPGLIIEQERHLLLTMLISFPAVDEYIAARERIKRMVEEPEHKFLLDHGYYDDILKDMQP